MNVAVPDTDPEGWVDRAEVRVRVNFHDVPGGLVALVNSWVGRDGRCRGGEERGGCLVGGIAPVVFATSTFGRMGKVNIAFGS